MEMNRETTIELTNALTDMLRNSFLDEVMPSVLAVLVRCSKCDSFHLLTYDAYEMLESVSPIDMIAAMMFGDDDPDGNNIIISACKNIGAHLASTGKEVLSVTLIASGGTISLPEGFEDGKTTEEVREIVKNAIANTDDRFILEPNVSVATFAHPDYYYQVSYKVEKVGSDDMLLTGRKEGEGKDKGVTYEFHETLINSASFLSRVSGAAKVKSCEPEPAKETVLSGDNEAKFRSIISRIEASLKIEDIL